MVYFKIKFLFNVCEEAVYKYLRLLNILAIQQKRINRSKHKQIFADVYSPFHPNARADYFFN